MYVLNLIRWKNLLILIFSAMLIRFSLLPGFGVVPELSLIHHSLLIFAVVCFGAGGNIINDFFDIATDSINRTDKLIVDKHISRQTTLFLYGLANLLGLASIFYLFLVLAYKDIALVFYILVCSPLLLASYSIWLKRKALLGNILVSVLVGLSFFCLGSVLIDQDRHPVAFFAICVYSVLAFLINLCRELIKDAEDIRGDYYCNMTTLPILIGKKRTNYLAFGLINLTVLFAMSIVLTYFLNLNAFIFYVFSLVIIPLILISRKLLGAKTEKDYKRISFHLKLVFLSGIGSMLTFLFL